MSRLIIVSNRLPVSIERRKGTFLYHQSAGGVATGLSSVVADRECLWLGWAEVSASRISASEREEIAEALLSGHRSMPVFLTPNDIAGFYHGFSNRTLWPLFHHFSLYAEFNAEYWRAYERVNRVYRDAILKVCRPDDQIWVHDYQLMLLPGMLREAMPGAAIGFFLHIPFPSYEVFRILPWRAQLLEGLLGADLIGFHTYDYAQQFMESARLLLGVEEHGGYVDVEGRQVTVQAFPMGIDVAKYERGASSAAAQRQALRVRRSNQRIVLSVDRLDYTKGIPERLTAFDKFLERNPGWRGRVRMLCVAVPSRERVEQYQQLKAEVDGLVGAINGRWSTVNWSPVTYLCHSVPFQQLVGMYAAADVALVTPLRDGMNLVAKEYVATRLDGTGVLILSEMAGAARELNEALLVNPYDLEAVEHAIETALEVPEDEQMRRNRAMQQRLKRYDVGRWANDFLGSLESAKQTQAEYCEQPMLAEERQDLLGEAQSAEQRLIVLDYDGTIVPFARMPRSAAPDESLLALLSKLAAAPGTTLLVVSGRDHGTLGAWLADTGAVLIAEHGGWIRVPDADWVTSAPLRDDWKPVVRPVLDNFVDTTPGSFVEEKDFSLALHYRLAQQEQAELHIRATAKELGALTSLLRLVMVEGNRVLEVRPDGIDKGRAAHPWMANAAENFVLVIGDDKTDEPLFEAAPEHAWTVKVGPGPSKAKANLRSWRDVRQLLSELVEVLT
ncbi:MAG: bifunctional alpha,alpha-trehalose-phosphate synthase (UDP-forming)/trehalose-phosphatase [Coriobacteriia bacterium]